MGGVPRTFLHYPHPSGSSPWLATPPLELLLVQTDLDLDNQMPGVWMATISAAVGAAIGVLSYLKGRSAGGKPLGGCPHHAHLPAQVPTQEKSQLRHADL
jgi:hypothetical protein